MEEQVFICCCRLNYIGLGTIGLASHAICLSRIAGVVGRGGAGGIEGIEGR